MEVQRELGSMGRGEMRRFVDAMDELTPGAARAMLAIRP